MTLELTTVDAFTNVPFTGNPAAVAIVDAFPDDQLMQSVAGEMNLSETAFVVVNDAGCHDLRWFTPTVEVDLCGHATLAAAHVLGQATRFHTRCGVLSCVPTNDGWIEMDFPADPPEELVAPPTLRTDGVVWYGKGTWDALVELDDATRIRNLQPDPSALAALGTRSVIFTAAGDREGIDCVSRVFAPNAGIPEDPVTGSAHCTLAEHWGERLDRSILTGEQASRRGGIVRMRREDGRVVLGGQAVTVGKVRLSI
ncbi:MAG: PhzF family phenazine biosynthesis protein [Acidimicrobiales bacterium]